ncbi:odorant receptor 82a-like [Vespula maculifrons]|uniref:Odorant receptor 82a-like n=1 Tax=Vespula maculifrons TaxID=7453 RepID=A0ABD2BPH5_VESMC
MERKYFIRKELKYLKLKLFIIIIKTINFIDNISIKQKKYYIIQMKKKKISLSFIIHFILQKEKFLVSFLIIYYIFFNYLSIYIYTHIYILYFFLLLQAIDVTEAMKSLLWNKQLLKYVGIWPLEISNALFFFFFIYLILHCSLTFAELTHRKHSLGDVMSIFTENILLLMTLTKITTCWLNRESLGHLLIELDDNFIVHNYNTLEKRFIFMKYTKLAKYYFLIAVTSMSVAVGLYYVNEMIPNVKIGNRICRIFIKYNFINYDLIYKCMHACMYNFNQFVNEMYIFIYKLNIFTIILKLIFFNRCIKYLYIIYFYFSSIVE